jgi:hypothetical protein
MMMVRDAIELRATTDALSIRRGEEDLQRAAQLERALRALPAAAAGGEPVMNARGTARRGPSAAAVAQAAQSRERLGGELAAVAARLAGKTQATLLKLFDPALLNLLHSGTEFLLANCQPGTVAGEPPAA